MSADAVSPWDVFFKALSQDERNYLAELIRYLNEELKAKMPKQIEIIEVDCSAYASYLGTLVPERRRLIRSLLKMHFLGANPPWGEVVSKAFFPKNPEKKAFLKIKFLLFPLTSR